LRDGGGDAAQVEVEALDVDPGHGQRSLAAMAE
jgi:hypothetical protein